ncbi:MAG: S1C family serine protease [Chloroflexia bacterium]
MQQAQHRWLVVVLAALGGLVLGMVLGTLFGGVAGYILGRGSLPLVEVEATPTPPPRLTVPALPWRWPFCPPCPETPPEARPEERPTPLPGVLGARVERVLPDTPAEEAGLRPGDVIVAVNGERITPERSLADLLARYRPGDTVTLTVRRDNERLEIQVRLGEHPERPGQAYLGIYFTPSRP